jgi:WD40 repeat protein
MAEEQAPGQNGSVFISYSRKDKDFVQNLYDGLVANRVKAWVDWEGIPLSADWMDEITRAIDGADTFLVIISPDWLASKVCAQELELGLQKNKKLVPILYRVPEKGTVMPEKLAATNWVYMRPEDDFVGTLPKLVEAINTDLDWVRAHTRLIQRATEWEKKNRSASFLLYGEDLSDGESWMSQAAMQASRQVLPLQADYILISRKDAVRRQRMTMAAISVALVISVLLGIMALVQWRQAGINAELAKSNAATAMANEKLAKENENLAKQSEAAAQANEKLAKQNEATAKDNEKQAKAQRNAAEAQLYQSKSGSLDISTLLAVDSWNTVPSFQAEDILRQNLSYLPIPVMHLYQGDAKLDNNLINNIEFSPDGALFASAGYSGSACLWKSDKGEQVFCDKRGARVTDAVFTIDGKQLVTAGLDGIVRFWDVTTGKSVNELDLKTPVNDLDLSLDKKWLAIARADNTFMVVNLLDPKAKQFLIKQPAAVVVVKFSPNSNWLGVATKIGKVDIWVPGSNFTIHGPDHGKEIFALAFNPESSLLVSVGADSRARVAKTASGKEVMTLVHGDWVEDAAFSPDGSSLATASDDNRVWVWDIKTGLTKYRLNSSGFVQKVRFSPDGQWIASTGYDQTARIWNAASSNKMLEAPLNSIGSSIAFAPDGQRIFVGDQDGNINAWNISLVNSRVNYIDFPEYVHELKYGANESWFVANTDDSKVWQLQGSDLLKTHDGASGKAIITTDGLTYALEVSPDSKWVAASEKENDRGVLYNVQTNTQSFLSHGSDVEDVAFTPDSTAVATAGLDGKVILWNTADGSKKFEIKNAAPVLAVDISPDGKTLVAGLEGRAATQVWDLTNQTLLSELQQIGNVTEMDFSGKGKWLATGDALGEIEIWDGQNLSANKPIFSLRQNGKISSLAFSFDERWLAAGGYDGFVHLWDLSTGNELARIPHFDAVTGLVFSRDNRILATASRKVVQFWDITNLILVSREALVDTACSRLSANLSQAEWETIYPAESYRLICPSLPKGQD